MTRAWKTFVTESIFWQTKVMCVRHKTIAVKWVSNCWQLQLSTFLQVQTCKNHIFSDFQEVVCSFSGCRTIHRQKWKQKSISQSSEHNLGILSLINLLNPFLNSLIPLISVSCKENNYNAIEFAVWDLAGTFLFHWSCSLNTNSIRKIKHFEIISLKNIPAAILVLFFNTKINILPLHRNENN